MATSYGDDKEGDEKWKQKKATRDDAERWRREMAVKSEDEAWRQQMMKKNETELKTIKGEEKNRR